MKKTSHLNSNESITRKQFLKYLVLGLVCLNIYLYTSAQGTWTKKNDFPSSFAGYNSTTCSSATKGYVIQGTDLWEYNPTSDAWNIISVFPGSYRWYSSCFIIDDKIYYGLGVYSEYLKDFWEYNITTNVWTRKTDFPGTERINAAAFSVGTKGYFCLGYGSSYFNDCWEYNPSTNAWTRKADFPGATRSSTSAFTIGTKGYIGPGQSSYGQGSTDFWEYDPSINVWTRKADVGTTARYNTVGFSIGSKGYLGLGTDDSYNYLKDIYEYDPSSNQWTRKSNYADSPSSIFAFGIGALGYIGGFAYDDQWNALYNFWELNPNVDPPVTILSNQENFKRSTCSGLLMNADIKLTTSVEYATYEWYRDVNGNHLIDAADELINNIQTIFITTPGYYMIKTTNFVGTAGTGSKDMTTVVDINTAQSPNLVCNGSFEYSADQTFLKDYFKNENMDCTYSGCSLTNELKMSWFGFTSDNSYMYVIGQYANSNFTISKASDSELGANPVEHNNVLLVAGPSNMFSSPIYSDYDWMQPINVAPNTDYEFSFYVAKVSDQLPFGDNCDYIPDVLNIDFGWLNDAGVYESVVDKGITVSENGGTPMNHTSSNGYSITSKFAADGTTQLWYKLTYKFNSGTRNNIKFQIKRINKLLYCWDKSVYALDDISLSANTPGGVQVLITGSTSICAGNTANLTITCTGGTAPYTVNYNYNNGTSTVARSVTIPNSNPYTLPVTDGGTYTLTSVTDQAGANVTISGQSATITVRSTVIPTITSDVSQFIKSQCSGLYLNAPIVLSTTGTYSDVKWYDDKNGNGQYDSGEELFAIDNLSARAPKPGTYNLRVTNTNGCISTVQKQLGYTDGPAKVGNNLICNGDFENIINNGHPDQVCLTSEETCWYYNIEGCSGKPDMKMFGFEFETDCKYKFGYSDYTCNAFRVVNITDGYSNGYSSTIIAPSPQHKQVMVVHNQMNIDGSYPNGYRGGIGYDWMQSVNIQTNTYYKFSFWITSAIYNQVIDFGYIDLATGTYTSLIAAGKAYVSLDENMGTSIPVSSSGYNFVPDPANTQVWYKITGVFNSSNITNAKFVINSLSINPSNPNSSNVYALDDVSLVTSTSVPLQATITGPTSICAGHSANLTITCSGGTSPYTVSYNYISGTTTVSHTLTVPNDNPYTLPVTDIGMYVLTSVTDHTSNNVSITGQSATLTVSPSLGTVGVITGTSTVSPGQNDVSYSTTEITNATSYNWTYSGTGATITGTTNDVKISFAVDATSGNLSVSGVNSCGTGVASANYPIAIMPAIKATLIGTTTICTGENAYLTITCTGGTGPYTVNYDYNNGTTTASRSVIADNDNPISLTVQDGGTYTLTSITDKIGVHVTITGQSAIVTLKPLPAAADVIVGASSVWAGQSYVSYRIPDIAYATDYYWYYSSSGVTVRGTSKDVLIDFAADATNGNLTVSGANSCGTGPSSAVFPVTIGFEPMPPTIISNQEYFKRSTCTGNLMNKYLKLTTGAAYKTYKWYRDINGNHTIDELTDQVLGTDQFIFITDPGFYMVKITNSAGIEGTATKDMTQVVDVNTQQSGNLICNGNFEWSVDNIVLYDYLKFTGGSGSGDNSLCGWGGCPVTSDKELGWFSFASDNNYTFAIGNYTNTTFTIGNTIQSDYLHFNSGNHNNVLFVSGPDNFYGGPRYSDYDWMQPVNVTPNTNYEFSFYVTKITDQLLLGASCQLAPDVLDLDFGWLNDAGVFASVVNNGISISENNGTPYNYQSTNGFSISKRYAGDGTQLWYKITYSFNSGSKSQIAFQIKRINKVLHCFNWTPSVYALDDISLVTTTPISISATLSGTTSICAGQTTNLSITCKNGTAPYTVNYSYNNGTSSVARSVIVPDNNPYTLTVTEGGTYTLTSITDHAGASASISGQSAVVNIYPTDVVRISPTNPPACVGQPITLLGNKAPSGFFSGIGIVDNANGTGTFNAAATGTYDITYSYTNTHGCVSSILTKITANPLPEVSFTGLKDAYSFGSTASRLIGNPEGGDFSGYLGIQELTDGTYSFKPIKLGEYTVVYAYNDGKCINTQSKLVTIYDSPQAVLTGTGIMCDGQATELVIRFVGQPPYSFRYAVGTTETELLTSSNSTYSIITSDIGKTYTLTYFKDNIAEGSTRGLVTIVNQVSPTASISGSVSLCSGQSGSLPIVFNGAGSKAFTYAINGIAQPEIATDQATFSLPVNNPGAYTLLKVIQGGCSGTVSGTANVTVYPLPQVNITGLAQRYCIGSSVVTIAGTPVGGTFASNLPGFTSQSGSTATFNTNASGNYHVTYTYSDGHCSNFSTVNPSVIALPVASIGQSTYICGSIPADINLVLQGSGSYDISWTENGNSHSGQFSAENKVISAKTTGLYSLVSVSTYGCLGTASGSATIVSHGMPSASLSATNSMCKNGNFAIPVNFIGEGPWTYIVEKNLVPVNYTSASAIGSFNVQSAGTYTITSVKDSYCENTAIQSTVISEKPLPVAELTGTGGICDGDAAKLVVKLSKAFVEPYSFVYAIDGVNQEPVISNGPDYTITTSLLSNYSMVSVEAGGCIGTSSGSIQVEKHTKPTVSITGGGEILIGTPITIAFGLTGLPSWNVTYLVDGLDEQIVTFSDNQSTMDVYSPGIYKFTKITDKYCEKDLVDEITITAPGEKIICKECIQSFAPQPGQKYILGAWVKLAQLTSLGDYSSAGVSLYFEGANITIGPLKPKGAIIDGWQRIEEEFVVPEAASAIEIRLVNESPSDNAYFDDIRLFPFKGNMKSYVYDPVTLRLKAVLDENNYATFYEYDEEGRLIRVKKETERGVKTIQESFNNVKIK